MNLSEQQKRAVERTGQDVCVVAGPGSGKTRVLVERFAWLVETQGVPPDAVLAVTFTEKAATEIKQRLVTRFAEQPEIRERIERAWVSTIDGFCTRLLQENAIAAGLAPDFNILDQPSADRLAREAAEEALEELYQERPADMRAVLEAVDLGTADDGPQSDLAGSLLDVYETMRLAGVREIPCVGPGGDVFAEARALVRSLCSGNLPRVKMHRVCSNGRGSSRRCRTLLQRTITSRSPDVSKSTSATSAVIRSRATSRKEILPSLESQMGRRMVWRFDSPAGRRCCPDRSRLSRQKTPTNRRRFRRSGRACHSIARIRGPTPAASPARVFSTS